MLIFYYFIVSVANPDPGPGAFLIPGSGMNTPDHISESLETKYLNSFMRIQIRHHFDPGSGMEKFGTVIWYKHPRTVTLFIDTSSGSEMPRRIRTRIQESQIKADQYPKHWILNKIRLAACV